MAEKYQSRHGAVKHGASPAKGAKASHAAKAPAQTKAAAPSPEPNEPKESKGGKVYLTILLLILGFCLLGAAVYALVHFVILAPPAEDPTELPALPTTPSLAQLPTDAPTEAPTEPAYLTMAEDAVQSMTLREKLCQLFIVTPEVLTGVDGVTIAGDTTKEALEKYPVGGVIYFSDNLESVNQTEEMIAKSQEYAKTPMFIAVDEEGGDVARVAEKLGTRSFDPMYTYKDKGADTARDNAAIIASQLNTIGFNLNFAPVADVWTNSDNTVIGERAYSDKYDKAAELVGAAVEGYADTGVLCTLKHFPGHGNTAEDSHEGLATVSATVQELKDGELLPFKSGIDAGADMVMVGHLVVTDLDDSLPATLSPKVVPELLRDYLGYDGVVISDSMQMAAITDNYDYDAIIKGLFDADIDVILQPDDLDKYIEALEKALDDGSITEKQIDAKVKKILALKYAKGIISMTAEKSAANPSENPSEDVSAPTETAALTDESAEAE